MSTMQMQTQTKAARKKKFYTFFLCLALLLPSICGCISNNHNAADGVHPEYSNYRDIPGITLEEIELIEALKTSRTELVYGMCPSTETFFTEQGGVGGYTALFCRWLTELFGIKFEPIIVEWDDLHLQMESGAINFTGELTATPERLDTYYMTNAIAERSINTFRLQNSESLDEIAQNHTPRFSFLSGSNTKSLVEPIAEYKFDTNYVNNYDEAVAELRNREADAFLIDSPAEEAFNAYDDIISEPFFPLVYTPVSLATLDPELAPIINIVQKCLDNGAIYHLTKLYNIGYQEYLRHKLFLKLTEEEKAYILDHANGGTAIPITMESDAYPAIFYNAKEKEWQGIACDVLKEITTLTGLNFEVINNPGDSWHILFDMVEDGKAAMTMELLYSKERKGRFLWADEPYTENRYALVSTTEHEDININQISYLKVALIYKSAYADIFNEWFPDHPNTVSYMSADEAFKDLKTGKIDLLMTSKSLLLRETNYKENSSFKANLIFERSYGSAFGFNKNEFILQSIFSKAQTLVDTDAITSRWVSKIFDYNSKISKAMVPYLSIFSLLLLVALIIVAYLFLKNRKINKNLEGIVTERTSELSLQTATLTTIFESIPDLVFCKDKRSNFTRCNYSFEKHFNCLEKDIVGMNEETGLGLHADLAEAYRESDRAIMNGQSSVSIEEIIPTADGEVRLFETIKTPLVQDGVPVGILSISRDITERKAAEQELESASRSKSDFLSHMSHEIRTSLNTIIGMNSIAMNSSSIEKANQYHERIDDASKHLLGIISDILDMSTIEANTFELAFSEFNFENMLIRVVNIINFRVEEKHQRLIINLGESVPVTILSDELRLSQVITNLLSNAVKFTPENGTILLNIEKTLEQEQELTLQIAVQDNGIGIPQEQQARLFNPFKQEDGSISRKFGGTGLGLAISKQIIELMDGTIWVESELGQGSTFSFTIKIKKVKKHAEKSRLKISSGTLPKINMNNIHVFAADTSAETLDCFLRVMNVNELPCDVANNSPEALEKIMQCPAARPYNIFFIDWKMPKIDGIALTKRIIEILGDNVIVFMISSDDMHGIEQEALSAGVRGFIPKPLFPSDIIDAINECLGVESMESDLRKHGVPQMPNFSEHSILIAEDIEVNQGIIAAVLAETKISITFADNGQKAVDIFRKDPEKYSLILMDIQMPGLNGLEATKYIRSLDIARAKSIPIIAMTANVFKEDIEQCLACGMNDHLGKPINHGKTIAKLCEYLSDSAQNDSTQV